MSDNTTGNALDNPRSRLRVRNATLNDIQAIVDLSNKV